MQALPTLEVLGAKPMLHSSMPDQAELAEAQRVIRPEELLGAAAPPRRAATFDVMANRS